MHLFLPLRSPGSSRRTNRPLLRHLTCGPERLKLSSPPLQFRKPRLAFVPLESQQLALLLPKHGQRIIETTLQCYNVRRASTVPLGVSSNLCSLPSINTNSPFLFTVSRFGFASKANLSHIGSLHAIIKKTCRKGEESNGYAFSHWRRERKHHVSILSCFCVYSTCLIWRLQ
jgi:hypothetical protein